VRVHWINEFGGRLVPVLQDVLKLMNNKPSVSLTLKFKEHAVGEQLAGFLFLE
jgi:hypothetical protein